MDKFELIAPCHFGLEAVMKREILDLGYEIIKVEDGKVTFSGDAEAIVRANMFLRTTERILLKVGQFKAVTFEELFEKTKALPWENYIPVDGKFWIKKANSVKSQLFSPSDIQSIMKKAMVERLKSVYHVEWFEEDGASYPVAQHVGDYMVEKQAHSEDETPFRTVKITHIASGKSKKLMIYDWSFCACSDQDGNLLIAQQNEKGNLEIRSYNAAMQESIVELSGDFLQNENVRDAACIGQTAYMRIRLTNEKSEILLYDITQQKITDSQTLLAVDDNSYIAEIKAAGAVLLSVDGYWNRELQRQKYQINLLNEHFETSRLPLQHESCLYIFTDVEQADVTTIEMDEKSHSYFVCSYRDTPHNCAQTIHVIPADQNFEKKCNSNALFAREISLVTQPSFDCEQGINSQVQTVCSNADAVFPVLGIVFCKNERFSLSRKTHVPLWNEPMISHVRLP